LTAEQEARLVLWRAEWFAIGSSTEPTDKPRAERAITAMYARIGKPAPRFIHVDSPATASLAIYDLTRLAKDKTLGSSLGSSIESSLWSSLGSSFGSSLRSSIESSLRSSLESSLRSSIESSLWTSLWSSIESSLRSSIESSLWSSLWSSLGSSLWSSLGSSLRSAYLGQESAYWVSFYAFCRDVVGVPYDAQKSLDLDLWSEVVKSCGWWWPFDGLCIVANRPESICWEPGRMPERLHCTTGPSVRYRDGWMVHSLRGVRVPGDVIDDLAKLTAERIDAEPNAEVRRVLIEHYGPERFVVDSGAEVVDQDIEQPGDRARRLLRKLGRDGHPDLLMLEVLNATPEPDGTRKRYYLKPHPELRQLRRGAGGQVEVFGEPQKLTCHNAVASTFGRRGENWAPVIET
jgi:hypothetical protein